MVNEVESTPLVCNLFSKAFNNDKLDLLNRCLKFGIRDVKIWEPTASIETTIRRFDSTKPKDISNGHKIKMLRLNGHIVVKKNSKWSKVKKKLVST